MIIVYFLGFKTLISAIYQYALKGYEERILIIQIRAIHRLIKIFLHTISQTPQLNMKIADVLVLIIKTILLLVKSVIVPTSEFPVEKNSISPFKTDLISPYADSYLSQKINSLVEDINFNPCDYPILILNQIDVKSLSNVFFIEEALILDSAGIVELLLHVSWFRSETDTYELIEFIVDKTIKYMNEYTHRLF